MPPRWAKGVAPLSAGSYELIKHERMYIGRVALPLAAWTATIGAMTWRAVWAGVKHDVGALLRHKPDDEGYIVAWDPSIPKGVVSHGPSSRRWGRRRHR